MPVMQGWVDVGTMGLTAIAAHMSDIHPLEKISLLEDGDHTFKENIKCKIFFKSNISVLTYFKHFYPISHEKCALTNTLQQTFLKRLISYHLGFQNTDFQHT